jgi:branched-chain amino acid transport system ATP-binding protein
MPLLETRGLTKSFGGLTAVFNLDLQVEEGEIVSLIGPNGAGKTTVFNLITGLYLPDKGDILFEKCSLVGLQPHQITALGVARTFQTLRIFTNMTVLENVMVAQHCRTKAGMWPAILRLPGFRREEEKIRQKAIERLSFFGSRLVGYRRRLEVARALATDPKLLLLDEPTAGMNPHETQEMAGLIGRLRDEIGCTILCIEHDMKVVQGISDRVVALDYGEKIAEGSHDEVADNERVIEAYLGRTAKRGEDVPT